MGKTAAKGKRKSYTEAEREAALELYRTEGPRGASKKTGIHASTLSRWARKWGVVTEVTSRTEQATEAAAAKRELQRERIRTLLLDKAEDILHRLDQEHVDFKVVPQGGEAGSKVVEVTYPRPTPTGAREYATAAAILIDKFRLEMGESTDRQRVEHTGDIRVIRQMSTEELEQGLAQALQALGTGRSTVTALPPGQG